MMDLIFILCFEVEEPVGPPRESYFTSGIFSSLIDKMEIIPTSCDCEKDNRYERVSERRSHVWAEHSGIFPRGGRDMNKTLSHALLPSPQAGSPAKDPGAEVSAALHFLSVVPHLPAGRVPGHGDTAEYLSWLQPEPLGDFTTHGLGHRYMCGAFHLWQSTSGVSFTVLHDKYPSGGFPPPVDASQHTTRSLWALAHPGTFFSSLLIRGPVLDSQQGPNSSPTLILVATHSGCSYPLANKTLVCSVRWEIALV